MVEIKYEAKEDILSFKKGELYSEAEVSDFLSNYKRFEDQSIFVKVETKQFKKEEVVKKPVAKKTTKKK